jgi:proteic killer suppression protein
MIRSFKGRRARRIWEGQRARKPALDLQRIARRKLRMLNNAQDLRDLRVPPGNHLERLGRDRKGQWSIRINDQWRICFRWHKGDAYDVEVVDYH